MEYIKTEEENLFLKVILNRPEKRNAFHPQMIQEITEVFNGASKNEELKGILLYGEGSSFCAGADLSWMKSMVDYSLEENREDSKKLHNMFAAIESCPLPVLCKAHGHVMGGALGLLAACDIVAVEEKTKFAFSEVQLGLVPAVISPFVLKKMSAAKAREFMITGERFDASEAIYSNLVHFSGDEDEVNEFLVKKMGWIQKAEQKAIAATKNLLDQLIIEKQPEQVKEITTKLIAERRVSDEAQARLRWFLDANK
ncbi:MAG: enoyl-CoA hydratase [Bdellovibrionaceae bacterium]|jgi:methylglutaconyl-CoA hydratase|nr:enoyl-CoA hydratase [Pseudobdellovibrionaceae bacterium]